MSFMKDRLGLKRKGLYYYVKGGGGRSSSSAGPSNGSDPMWRPNSQINLPVGDVVTPFDSGVAVPSGPVTEDPFLSDQYAEQPVPFGPSRWGFGPEWDVNNPRVNQPVSTGQEDIPVEQYPDGYRDDGTWFKEDGHWYHVGDPIGDAINDYIPDWVRAILPALITRGRAGGAIGRGGRLGPVTGVPRAPPRPPPVPPRFPSRPIRPPGGNLTQPVRRPVAPPNWWVPAPRVGPVTGDPFMGPYVPGRIRLPPVIAPPPSRFKFE